MKSRPSKSALMAAPKLARNEDYAVLRLQFALQLIEKAPVGALCDELFVGLS